MQKLWKFKINLLSKLENGPGSFRLVFIEVPLFFQKLYKKFTHFFIFIHIYDLNSITFIEYKIVPHL